MLQLVCPLKISYAICRSEIVVGWYHSHPGFGCWYVLQPPFLSCFHKEAVIRIILFHESLWSKRHEQCFVTPCKGCSIPFFAQRVILFLLLLSSPPLLSSHSHPLGFRLSIYRRRNRLSSWILDQSPLSSIRFKVSKEKSVERASLICIFFWNFFISFPQFFVVAYLVVLSRLDIFVSLIVLLDISISRSLLTPSVRFDSSTWWCRLNLVKRLPTLVF